MAGRKTADEKKTLNDHHFNSINNCPFLFFKGVSRFFLPCIFTFFLFSCTSYWHVSKMEFVSIELNDSLEGIDSSVLALISPYKATLDKTMNEVLNSSDVEMTNEVPEGLLGNFVADLILKKANDYYVPEDQEKAKICILNNGGLRTSLPKGNISRGKVFELMPFENELCILTLSGKSLSGLFEYLANSGGAPVSGIKMGIENGLPVKIIIDGTPFDTLKKYKVVTSDYLANGGDKYSFLSDPLDRTDLHIKIRDAIIRFIEEEKQNGKVLSSKFDGRIYYVH